MKINNCDYWIKISVGEEWEMMQNSSGIGRKGKIISNVQITENVLKL